MSAEQLRLIQSFDNAYIEIEEQDKSIMITNHVTCDDKSISETIVWLDRGQANLLMLYLQEHLK